MVLHLQEAQKRQERINSDGRSISLAKEHALYGRYEHSDDPGRIHVIDSSGRFLPDSQLCIQRSKGVVRDNRIEFAFNSLSFQLQMSYMNVAIDRVLKRRWRKHMDIAFIVTAHCECQNVLK